MTRLIGLLGIKSDDDTNAYEHQQQKRSQRKLTLSVDETVKNGVILKGHKGKFVVGTLNVDCDKLVVEL